MYKDKQMIAQVSLLQRLSVLVITNELNKKKKLSLAS